MSCLRIGPVVLFAATLIASSAVAEAAQKKRKKPTYEEAWKLCTAQLDKQGTPRDWQSQRQAAGGACMRKYGYRL